MHRFIIEWFLEDAHLSQMFFYIFIFIKHHIIHYKNKYWAKIGKQKSRATPPSSIVQLRRKCCKYFGKLYSSMSTVHLNNYNSVRNIQNVVSWLLLPIFFILKVSYAHCRLFRKCRKNKNPKSLHFDILQYFFFFSLIYIKLSSVSI